MLLARRIGVSQTQGQQCYMAQSDYKTFSSVFPGRTYFTPMVDGVVTWEVIELYSLSTSV